jgi:hypothetical protein
MNKRWKRLLLLRCNRRFLADVAQIRLVLGIPPNGFAALAQGETYAQLLDYHRNGAFAPLDLVTMRPQTVLPPTGETYDVRGPSPLLLNWGIGKFNKGGGSSVFPNEDFDILATDPLDQHVVGLIIRYGLPDTESNRRSIRNFILMADDSHLDFAPPIVRGITSMSVEGFEEDEEYTVTLNGLSPDISQKDWMDLYPHLRELMSKEGSYREPNRFEFHRFMYYRVKIQNVSMAKAEIEWAEVNDDIPLNSASALSQAFHELEELMKPRER